MEIPPEWLVARKKRKALTHALPRLAGTPQGVEQVAQNLPVGVTRLGRGEAPKPNRFSQISRRRPGKFSLLRASIQQYRP
jgi:hypothetical protein